MQFPQRLTINLKIAWNFTLTRLLTWKIGHADEYVFIRFYESHLPIDYDHDFENMSWWELEVFGVFLQCACTSAGYQWYQCLFKPNENRQGGRIYVDMEWKYKPHEIYQWLSMCLAKWDVSRWKKKEVERKFRLFRCHSVFRPINIHLHMNHQSENTSIYINANKWDCL